MLSSGYSSNQRENFLKIKMEEQTVPSAGFSPQPEYMTPDCSSNNSYYGVPQQNSNGQPVAALQSMMNGCLDFHNLADSFDLSLLGDSYEDKDMATVPSPSAWSSPGSMEPTTWQQMSFYAASPPDFRAFSPDCTPVKTGFVEMTQQRSPAGAGNVNNASNNSNHPSPNNLVPAVSPPPGMMEGLPYQNTGVVNVTNSLSTEDVANCGRNNILLRQCLEDNTFIEKYNFKPLDLPITTLPNEQMNMENTVPTGATGVGSTLELNQIEPVFNLAYEQIISDIQNTCRTLAISPDPIQWSVGDVQSWLCYSLSSILVINSERGSATTNNIRVLWNIDGQRLCSLTEDEFRQRDPLNGIEIFANLELLKMAQWKLADMHQQSTPGQNSAQNSTENGQMSSAQQQPFDLGQILLNSVQASTAGYSLGSPGSCSSGSVSSMEQSPLPASFDDIKAEMDDSHTQANTPAKFSSPSSVDTASLRNSDDDDEEEEEEEKPVGKTKACGAKNGAHIHLWQFLKELLASGQQHGSCIRWLDQTRGVFKIEDSVRVARLWGLRKNRPAMNYDKLSRSIRQYYRKGIMRKTERSQRLVYQFCHPYGL